MDGKVTVRAVFIAAVIALMLPARAAMADDYLCDATQASNNELPVLSAGCPIGDGLWGKKRPRNQENLFWVQCGILDKQMPLKDAKPLYRQISADVWMKKEGKGYRCLIGPYEDYATALSDWNKVRKLAGYQDVFIREVAIKPDPKPAAKPAKQKRPAPKPAQKSASLSAKPAAAAPAAAANFSSAPKAVANGNIEIRRKASLNGHNYVVPYINDGSDTFYMEYDTPWNRMNYKSAKALCGKLSMRLANHDEWQAILQSDELGKNRWPVHLPYWGINQQGFFTSGKVTQLKGTSLLNVLCIEP